MTKKKAIEAIRKYADTKHSNGEQIEYVNGILKSISVINEQPTADVAEVKRGHWISSKEAEKNNRYDLAYCCSVCGRCDWDCTESETFNYCPNCGAKMDGTPQKEG